MQINDSTTIRPMPFWQSLLWFGLPGLIMLIGVTWLNPQLVAMGIPLIWSFSLLFYGPILAVAIAAIIAYRADGYPFTWASFAERMRLTPMRRRDWAWAGGGLIVALLLEGFIADPAMRLLAQLPLFAPPPALPALFDPFQPFEIPPSVFFGQPLAGNFWVIGVYAVCLLINIGGEELVWRGYVLPRQERTHGHLAWMINGLLWIVLFHMVIRWMYLGLIPTGFITPWVAHQTKNTWTAIIIHGTGNAIFLILLIIGVLNA